MKIQKPVLFLIALFSLAAIFLGFVIIHASSPSFTLSAIGNGDNVQITINGDANSVAVLYYQNATNYGTQSAYLGQTNSSGYLSMTISTTTYNIRVNSPAYVVVNSQQSQTLTWPSYSSYNYNQGISFDQTNPVIVVGQNKAITMSQAPVYDGSTPTYYISSNSNTGIVGATINNNYLTISGLSVGSSTITVCSSTGKCGNLSIVVNYSSYNYGGTVSPSQTNVTVSVGQTAIVYVSGSGGYYLSNINNSNIATASLNSNTLTIYGVSVGNTTISVCQYGGQCATIYVSVNSNYYNYNNYQNYSLNFSQTNPNLSIGQTAYITVSGGTGSYYISSNSNPNAIQAYISGSSLTLTPQSSGNSTITVCSANTNACGTIYATSSGNYNYYNQAYYPYYYQNQYQYPYQYQYAYYQSTPLSLGTNSMTLNAGQAGYLSIFGNGNYYIANNSNPNVAIVVTADDSALVYGVNSGNTSASICQQNGQCANLNISVTGTAGSYPTSCPPCRCQ